MLAMKKTIVYLFFGILLSNASCLLAQGMPSEEPTAEEKFEDAFFESLKQKGIENYDKAIVSLEKCLELEPNNTAALFEMGKNSMFQKDYKKAYDSFEKAAIIEPKNKWFLNGMYDVCYQTQDFDQAVLLVEKLIALDKSYREDLVSLYMKTQQYDKALTLINLLNDEVGKSEKRTLIKAQILTKPEFQSAERTNLLDQIKKYPKEESNYVALISLYNNNNQEKEALELTKKLETEFPNSDWAQVNLFKTNLDNNDGDKAVIAMNKVLGNPKIDAKIRHRIFNEFLIFTGKNPKYIADLDHAIGYFNDDKEVKVAKELGKFYQTKKDWDAAIKYYEMDAKISPNAIETTLFLLECYSQKLQFDVVNQKANVMMELYPLQPEFYYYSGLANNQLKNFKKAKEVLETGIDYLVDNIDLEINFNIQLGEAYSGLGDVNKKESYFLKADKLLKQKK
jgi:tetratricopeptide (TPR) repeat protein